MIDVIVFDLGGVIVNVNFDSPLGLLFDNSRTLNNTIKDKSDISRLLKKFETGKISTLEFYERIIDTLGVKLSFNEFKKVSIEAIKTGDNGINKSSILFQENIN